MTFGGGMTMVYGGLSLFGVRLEVTALYPALVQLPLYLGRRVLGRQFGGGARLFPRWLSWTCPQVYKTRQVVLARHYRSAGTRRRPAHEPDGKPGWSGAPGRTR